MINKTTMKRKGGSLQSVKRGQKIFAAVMLTLPLLQFFIFYVCVNANQVLLAFQKYNMDGDRVSAGLENFKNLFYLFKTDAVFKYALKNSLTAFVFATFLPIPVTMLFAYYISKRGVMAKYFKVMLFVPSIVSSIVLVMVYMYFVDSALPTILETIFKTDFPAFYSNYKSRFTTIIVFAIIMGFGGNVLMYLSAMNSINESIVEAARLDGANLFQEFIHVTFPMVYPTFVTFLIIGITSIFTNQLNLVSFMGTTRPLPTIQTFGYYIYQQTAAGESNYPRIAALGLLITLIVAPLTFLAKWLLEKYGPSAEER